MPYPKQVGSSGLIADMAASGAIPLPSPVEQYRSLAISQATAAVIATIPAPSDTSILFALPVSNSGTAIMTVQGVVIPAGASAVFVWSGSVWSVPQAAMPDISTFPTVLPATAGVWWLDGGVLSVSQ